MYEGATENDPLLKATTIKYELRYAQQKLSLQRSLVVFLITLSLVFVFDIARLIIRRDTYDPGNGNMLPQAIMVVMIGAFVAFFKHREKTSILVVVHITVLVLFFLFSLAILPSFIKEILIDFDVLCPVMIALTGLTAIICASYSVYNILLYFDSKKIICIVISYKFLKFHRKYMKRKATLPAVLHASPDWQNPYTRPNHGSGDLAGVASVLFPTYQPDPKIVQEQWEKFQQSRLYLPENKPQARSPRARAPTTPAAAAVTPGPLPPPVTPTPGQPTLTAQERWERFQRSPIFHSVNHGEASPEIGRARRHTHANTTPDPRTQHPTVQAAPQFSSQAPHQVPNIPPHAPLPHLRPTTPPALLDTSADPRVQTQHYPPTVVSEVTPTAPPPQTRARLSRNPSFRYGAYVHEPVAFRAHPDDTPEEYTQVSTQPQPLASHTRSESLPNIVAAAQQQQQQPTHPSEDEPIPLDGDTDRYESFDTAHNGSPTSLYGNLNPELHAHKAQVELEARKDKRLSLPAEKHAHTNSMRATPAPEAARLDSISSRGGNLPRILE